MLHIGVHVYYSNSFWLSGFFSLISTCILYKFFQVQKSAKWEGPGTIQAGGCGFSNHINACIIHANVV